MITFLKSFIVGICAILPGVSGSVIAVSLGIYDRFIEVVTDTRKIRTNKMFIILVVTGIISGFFLTSNLLIFIFKYETIIYYTLLGVIISEIPILIKKIHNYNGNKIKIFPLMLAFIFSLILELLNSDNTLEKYSIIRYFLGGILFSFGKVFPGVSSSFFLLCLGIYDDIIILVTNPFLLFKNIYFYFPFIIGTIFGLVLFLRILSYLLTNKYETVYSMILGFILSSIIIISPKFTFDITNIIGLMLMIVSFTVFTYVKNKNG